MTICLHFNWRIILNLLALQRKIHDGSTRALTAFLATLSEKLQVLVGLITSSIILEKTNNNIIQQNHTCESPPFNCKASCQELTIITVLATRHSTYCLASSLVDCQLPTPWEGITQLSPECIFILYTDEDQLCVIWPATGGTWWYWI